MITDMDIDMNAEILSNPTMNTPQEAQTYKNNLLKNIVPKNSIPENTYIIRGDEYLQTVELGRDLNSDVRIYSPQDYKFGTPIYLSKTTYTIGLERLSSTMDILDFRKMFHECCFRAGFHIEANYMNNLEKHFAQNGKDYISIRRISEVDHFLDLSSDSADIHHHDTLVFTDGISFKSCIVYITYYIGVWKENTHSTNKTYVIDFQFINNSASCINKLIGKIQQQFTLKNYKNYDWKLLPYNDVKKTGIQCPLSRKQLNAIASLLNKSIKV